MQTLNYSVGEKVQVWSQSKNDWLQATVEAVFPRDAFADGYSVAAGTVKVSSEAGIKWVMPDKVSALLRKTADSRPKAGHPAGAQRERSSATAASRASTPGARPGRANSTSSVGSGLCKNGCGRVVQPGLTRGLKPYDTCCKRCAQKPGSDEHDENCGGRRISSVSKASDAAKDLSSCLKGVLEGMLQDHRQLQAHVEGVFTKVLAGSDRLSKAQVKNGLQLIFEPFGVSLVMHDTKLDQMYRQYGQGDARGVGLDDFIRMCRAVLQDHQKLWFPETLPVRTSTFVKRNYRPLEEIYKMGEKLGEGSFGIVYKVEHRISGEHRVCKKIAKKKSDMSDDQILQEIGNMALLDHPNVIKVYEYFNDDQYVSQIMEPCYGGELQDKVDVLRKTGQAPYDEAFICDVMKQTLRAVAFMHTKPFLHKDLKPQNIMLVDTECASIKVIDFGLAELFNKGQEYAAFVGGTLLYMAPEVFRQKMTVKIDVWSAGVILFNMCTGDFPFIATWPPPAGKDAAWWHEATIKKISNEKMKDHPGLQRVSAMCRDLLMKMLDKDDSRRPYAAQCLEHPWFRQNDDVPPTLSVGVVQCVEAYMRMSELKKAIFLMIAHQCEVQAVFELRALFTHFDTRNRGSLSTEDLRQVLTASGMGHLTAERVIHALDRNSDAEIGWTEFTAAAICVSVCRNTRVVDAVFCTFDTDKDGKITAEDLIEALAEKTHGTSMETWQRSMPDLFDEIAKTEASVPASPVMDIWKSITHAFKQNGRASKEQFRCYVGEKMDFRAGDALHAVY